ncbi:hypothetical protein niasHS_016209 [Heterodera schachtii]|uniref:Secreted protein n=2 Tax=Heterodera TaxID=34509 RepID=A0ABD2HWG0_HETSC
MAKFVGIALLALTIASMAFARHGKDGVDEITEKLSQTNIDSKPNGDAEKEPAADKATKNGKAPKTKAKQEVATNEPAAANEWNDQLMGMSVDKFNEELAVLLPKANTFMENALSFINEQMKKNGIATGAAGGSCSAGVPAN